MGEDKNRRPIRTPHHTKQQIPANKQKPQKTTIIPMKLNPANKQTTFEKRLPINVIHLEITGTKIGIRYHTLTKKEKSCLNLAWTLVGQTYTKEKKKKKKKKKGGRRGTKKKKKKKKKK